MTNGADALTTLAAGSKTFHLASRLLPAPERRDAACVYAFCRWVDDLADEATSREVARRALADARAEIGSDRPGPRVAALHDVARRTTLDLDNARALVDTCASDLGPVRIPDDDALIRYAYGVAGTVGLMMCAVVGVQDPAAKAYAVDLGVAMQITNICRDVAEDARRDRVYLPTTRLVAAGTTRDALVTGRAPRTAIREVVRDLLALAERHYDAALDGMRFIPWRPRLAILAAARGYRAIGLRLSTHHDGDPMHGRTVVPPLIRLGWTIEALGWSFHPRTWGGRPLMAVPADRFDALRGQPGFG